MHTQILKAWILLTISSNILRTEDNQKDTPSLGGNCANCWGYQQYDGKISKLLKYRQIDINIHKDSYMVIQEFLKENIDGFKLKEGGVKECPTCGGNDSNAIKND